MTDPPTSTPSPLQLLHWRIGPLFALLNLALIPCFATAFSLSFGRSFRKRPPDPWEDFWISTLSWLSIFLVSFLPVQALLVTIGFTWGPGNFWRRFVQHFSAVLMVAGTYIGGYFLCYVPAVWNWLREPGEPTVLGWDRPDQRMQSLLGFVAIFCSLPILFLAVQLPFWLARHFCGCRLVKDSELQTSSDTLALRDLFVATAIVAISIGLLQFSDRVFVKQGSWTEQGYLFWMLLVSAVCGGVSLIVGLPLALIWLRARNLWFTWKIMLTVEIVLLIAYGLSAYYFAWTRIDFTNIVVMAFIFSLGSGAGFTILRRHGWRLATRWSDNHG